MSNPKNQHYVPRLYLKNFAFHKKEGEHIYVGKKNSEGVFESNIKNIASEKDFYTLHYSQDKYEWENQYANVLEPHLQNTLKKIVSRSNLKILNSEATTSQKLLSQSEKIEASFNFAHQFVRTKKVYTYLENSSKGRFDKAVNELENELCSVLESDNEKAEVFNKFKMNQDGALKDVIYKGFFFPDNENSILIGSIAKIMFIDTWQIYKIQGESEFVTSDCPILPRNRTEKCFDILKYFKEEQEAEFVFPISPKICIVMYSPNKYYGALNEQDCRLQFISSDKEKVFIHYLNFSQALLCDRFFFAHDKKIICEMQTALKKYKYNNTKKRKE